MKFIDKITGNDLTRDYQEIDKRVAQLPTDFQTCWEQIFVKIRYHSNFTGRNLTPIYFGILEMLEEMNELGKTTEEIFGNDIDGFCNALTADEPTYDVRDKWRKKLNNKIEKKFK